MKKFYLLVVSLALGSWAFSQIKNDSLYKNGQLWLYRDLSGELNLVTSHVNEDQENHSHQWAYYLNRPNPSVATVEGYFNQAANEFAVPVDLLKAIGFVENNYTQVGPSIDQGWGIMHLVQNNYCNTLHEAAVLLGTTDAELKDDPQQNIRGAAALLRKYLGIKQVKPYKGKMIRIEDWYLAAAKYSGLISDELRIIQADRYYSIIKDGAHSTTLWNEEVHLSRHKNLDLNYIEVKFKSKIAHAKSLRSSDYGPAVSSFTTCNFATGRTHSVDTWVNHWIGTGTTAGAVSWFQNCSAQVSAHFVVNNSGTIYQVVPVANTAWHCGASGYPYNNSRSIGTEHEATVSNPGLWNSTAMQQASAQMACYFCTQFGIPTNQNHTSPGICGHQNMPGTNTDCPGTIPWSSWFGYFNTGSCNAQPPVQPANDYCGNAQSLTVYGSSCGGATSGDINGATQSAAPTSCDGYSSSNANDVWYTFVATATAHDITVVPSSGMDAVVDLRTSCPGTTIDCEDAAGGEGATEVLHATGLSIGTTYYVRVYDYTGASIPPGTTTFTICITTPCTVPVKPLISGTSPVCSGNTTTLTVSNPCGGCSYAWSNGANGSQITVGTAASYAVTASNSCGVVGSDPFTLVVTQGPNPVINNLSNAYCLASADANMSGSPAGGTFSGNGVNGSVFSPSSAGAGTHIISYTVTQNGCTASTSLSVLVSANPSVQITANGPTSFCSGNSVVLTATQGSSYNWSNGYSTQAITVQQTGNYNVTVTNPGGCNANVSANSPQSVTVYPNPVASAGPDQTLLQVPGNSVVIGGAPTAGNGTGPYNYLWLPSAGLNSNTLANPVVSGLNSSTTYTLQLMDANGCAAYDSITVFVSQPCAMSIQPDYAIFSAAGGTDSFYVNVTDTVCGSWNVTTCNFISILSPALPAGGDAEVVYMVLPNTSTAQRSCQLSLTGGQHVLILQDGVTVNPCSPALPSPNVQLNFCELAADNISGVSYQWFNSLGAINGANTRFYSADQSGYYYVQIADSNFCTAQSQDVFVSYPSCLATAIAGLSESAGFEIHPNTSESWQISVSKNFKGSHVKLFNLTGQLLQTLELQGVETIIPNAGLPKGIYVVELFNDTGYCFSKKVPLY